MSRGASSSSCNSWVHRACNLCHGGSRVSGSPTICDCRDIVVVRTARTTPQIDELIPNWTPNPQFNKHNPKPNSINLNPT